MFQEIEILLEDPYANLEARDANGCNALHKAIVKGDVRCTKKLIETFPYMIIEAVKPSNNEQISPAISTPPIKDYSGCTPLDIAKSKGDKVLIQLLEKNIAKFMNKQLTNTANSLAENGFFATSKIEEKNSSNSMNEQLTNSAHSSAA